MNLTTDKWIPIIRNNGTPDKVSLLDAFLQGDEIRDLAVRPHERIALMRLLICIAHAALDGPKDRDDWRTCRARLPSSVADYLAKWKAAFALYGPGPRFLQMEGISPTKAAGDRKANAVAKFDLDLASGETSTLFDNAGGGDRRFTPARVAVMLLAFQCFSPGGLLSECLWGAQQTKKAGNEAAPCLSDRMVHTFVLDRTCLLNQIWLNLVSRDAAGTTAWGRPVWEMMPRSPDANAPEVLNALHTHLGRLVPLSRAVWLSDDGTSVIWGCGLEYAPFAMSGWRDPFATIYRRKDRNGEQTRAQLSVSLDRALWRELHAITVMTKGEHGSSLGGPMPLSNLSAHGEGCDVWAGGLVHKQKAKILEAVESILHIPAGMFGVPGQRAYSQGIQQAEQWGLKINYAVSTFHHEYHDDLDKAEFRKRGYLVKRKAASHYWTAIEQKVSLLLALVEDPAALYPESSAKANWANTDWGKVLTRAAVGAYQLACPHGTPRQLKAYSLGLNALFKPIEASKEEPVPEETEA